MRIEKYFYTETEKWHRDLEEEIAKEQALLTEEERQIQAEKTKKEAEMIIERGEHILNAIRYVTNDKLVQRFERIYKNMLCFAEIMSCDIIIESDMEKHGKILLRYNYLLFDDCTPKGMLPAYIEMLENASMTTYYAKGSVTELECHFELANQMYMKSLL